MENNQKKIEFAKVQKYFNEKLNENKTSASLMIANESSKFYIYYTTNTPSGKNLPIEVSFETLYRTRETEDIWPHNSGIVLPVNKVQSIIEKKLLGVRPVYNGAIKAEYLDLKNGVSMYDSEIIEAEFDGDKIENLIIGEGKNPFLTKYGIDIQKLTKGMDARKAIDLAFLMFSDKCLRRK